MEKEGQKRPVTEREALLKLTALCSRAEHCTGEMLEKLRRWEVDEEVQARIIAYLTEHKYVDDERFCTFFIRDKIKYNRWGRRKVEQALYAKRIPKDVYAPLLNEIEAEEYAEILRPLIENKRKTTKAKNAYELKMKLIKFALGRGFDMNVIQQCIGDVEEYPED